MKQFYVPCQDHFPSLHSRDNQPTSAVSALNACAKSAAAALSLRLLFELKFYGPVKTVTIMSSRSVNVLTLFHGQA